MWGFWYISGQPSQGNGYGFTDPIGAWLHEIQNGYYGPIA